MKIWCDVCDKEQASVFCSADEAALCDACDRRVHHANKLASKHSRFNLVNPSFKESPLCDICQKRRALLFCREDRAILCRECDIPIHKANEYTKKHNRFLLTGVKLSASASNYNPSPSSSTCCDQTATTSSLISNDQMLSSNSTSSISEYLMETLPGWCVEDFLDPSSYATSTNVLCKIYDQVFFPSQNVLLNGLKEPKEAKRLKVGRKRSDGRFIDPQIRVQSLVQVNIKSNARLIC